MPVAKYTGPVCRFCRREGLKLFLKGERCLSERCAFERRNYAPGQHGQHRSKLSDYGLQMREKQKVRRVYGMQEKQFRDFFRLAASKRGVTSEIFFQNLELRLDNVVYRMGFASSRQEARQVVNHRHILVNGKIVNIPSARVKVGDVVSIKEKSASNARFALASEHFSKRASLPWIEVDSSKFTGKVVALPKREDIQLDVKEHMIVELYSK